MNSQDIKIIIAALASHKATHHSMDEKMRTAKISKEFEEAIPGVEEQEAEEAKLRAEREKAEQAEREKLAAKAAQEEKEAAEAAEVLRKQQIADLTKSEA